MKVTVQGTSGELAFDCGRGESVLFAGLRQGISLPFECATGTCGTCRARVISGEVDVRWEQAPGAARLKADKGDILMCQTRVRSDCVLRVPSMFPPKDGARPGPRRAIIGGLRRLTKDVAHFDLKLLSPMSFEAGQFVVIEAAGISGGRAYSMVNFARDCERVELVIKRKPGGRFGDWLFDQFREDAQVDVFGPLGRAIFRPEEGRSLMCVAGGSGIAGMMAILDRALQEDYFRGHAGTVYFGVRTLRDAFYLERLSAYVAASHGNLDVAIAVSDEGAATARHAEFPVLRLESGMVHEVTGREMALRKGDVLAYVAGPPVMVEATIRTLVTAGLASKNIRYDKFS
jgi:toluene monooxygenase electron transfer component